MPDYRKGFTKDAEAIAEEMRSELGIGNVRPLDPLELARYLELPVCSLDRLAEIREHDENLHEALAVLYKDEQSTLSALTVFRDGRRLIIYNQQHPEVRQVSDLCHEFAHGLLLHEPAPVLDGSGCRAWNSEVEAEASFLGGALLIPGKAARWAAMRGFDDQRTAHHFKCSLEMATWRLNASGARKFMKRK